MNHDMHDTADPAELPDALRWQLRALREEHAPAADLWPRIADRLSPSGREHGAPPVAMSPWTSTSPAPPTVHALGNPARRGSSVPVALAASVLVAVSSLGLLRHGGPPAEGQAQAASPRASTADSPWLPSAGTGTADDGAQHVTTGTPLALAEAEGLRLQYEGAIRELETRPGAAAPNPTLRTLDQSAALILAALRQAPDSTRLLEQLRRTYQRRLDLMRLPLA